MKNMRVLVLFSAVAFAFATTAAWAVIDYPVPPNHPSWWKIPSDPADGVTRTQFHSFITDPNPADTPPDYTYNGFSVAGVADSWTFSFTPPFNTPIPGGVGPNYGDDGFGIYFPLNQSMEKWMWNLPNPKAVKQFFVCVSWWDWLPNASIAINCYSEDTQVSQTLTKVDGPIANGGQWHTTYLEGIIIPQPGHEYFQFTCDIGELPYIDSIWVGTHCVPEPSTIAMMAFGALGVAGGVIRKIRR